MPNFESQIEAYLTELTTRCQAVLGNKLIGLYVVGSGAQCDQTNKSDLDVIGILFEPLPEPLKDQLAQELNHSSLPVPASGLDLLLVTRDSVQNPQESPEHQFWFSTGAAWQTEIDKGGHTSEHLIVFAVCRDKGHPLYGPAPVEIFAPAPRNLLLRALISVLEWHRKKILDPFHDPLGQYSVLNACRAWRYAEEGELTSKSAGAEWVLSKEPENVLVKSALAIRQGKRTMPLDREEIDTFLSRILSICRATKAKEDARN
jgi:hypothetical protein